MRRELCPDDILNLWIIDIQPEVAGDVVDLILDLLYWSSVECGQFGC
jgi:hypothetical protein